ncbi:MAG: Fe(3+) ABC transporter substrate-binding protein [Gammaproteobacteria bacterium]|nr:MAG: Fe(3+) ABC transporter substrate-binding protein [Gammaproteobacteria bacterium]
MYRRLTVFKPLAVGLVCTLGLLSQVQAQADEVNVYSARKEALILPLLKKFEAETGIGFNLVTAKADALLKRLESEGRSTPADLFITTDAGRLQRAKEAGVLQPIESSVLTSRIPENLRDRENYWFGLSQRARVIFYAKSRVNAAELSTYEALADDKWKQRICVRSSGNIYNQSLVASMIEAQGIETTEAWAKGLVANFARKPAGGDTDQLRAAAAGLCDIAIANTYYYGRLVNSDKDEDRQVAEKLAVFWPNQADRGAHVNVSGAGITRHAKHRQAAERLLEFLVSAEAQTWYAEVNNEYPVVADARTSAVLESFGDFRGDSLNLTRLGENNRAAVELMDRAGWR